MSISASLLHAFVALEESLNFTRAAECCNVTQSSLSQMIRRLESTVGRRLFDRDTHSVRLTVEGALFSGRARRILNEIDEALGEMRDFAAYKRGKLSVALNPSLVASWLPDILAEYKRRYPGIAIEVFDTFPSRALKMLQDESVEIVICPEPGSTREGVSRRLFREPFFLACPAGHPIAAKRSVQRKDFAGLPIMYAMGTENSRVYANNTIHKLRQFMRLIKTRDTGIEVEHLPSLTTLVGAGLGCAIVPHMARAQVVSAGVAMVPVSRNLMMREIYLVQRDKLGLSAAATGFLEIAEASIASMSL